MSLLDQPETAQRLARAISSDLWLYHSASLQGFTTEQALQHLAREVEEGRALFASRTLPEFHALYQLIPKNAHT
jgi:hypothetical protein